MENSNTKKCIVCGATLGPDRYGTYCSKRCYKKKKKQDPPRNDPILPGTLILRKFNCKKCNRLVRVVSKNDHRTKFCCAHCEMLYYKHS